MIRKITNHQLRITKKIQSRHSLLNRSFTLIELIVSVALLLVALSIALFAVVGSSGLIQKTDARGVVSEGGRSIGDSIRRATINAPIGAVSLTEPIDDAGTYAAIRVKQYSSQQSSVICTTIGRAELTQPLEQAGGEETYSIVQDGPLVALLIHQVDLGGLCPAITTTPIYQNRLTSAQTAVNDLQFYRQTFPCDAGTQSETCIAKEFLRYSLEIKQIAKEAGLAEESRSPSITISDGIPIGLVNESTTPLTIESPSVLPPGTVGQAYSETLSSSGGAPDYTWTIVGGSLPNDLTLDPNTGDITGIPSSSSSGTFDFTVKVEDSQDQEATKPLSITIFGQVVITSSTLSPPTANVGVLYYSVPLTAIGGSGAFIWSLDPGSPAWLKFGVDPNCTANSSVGIVCGTPQSESSAFLLNKHHFWAKLLPKIQASIGGSSGTTYNVYIRVTDAADPTNTATRTMTLQVNP